MCEHPTKKLMAAACPYDPVVSPYSIAARAPVASSVERIGLLNTTAEPRWNWMRCATAPLPNAAALFPGRQTWRDPSLGSLCCVRGPCFRAVIDDQIILPVQRYRVGQKVRVRNSAIRVSPSAGWELARVTSISPVRARRVASANRRGEIFDEVRPADDDRQSIDEDVDAAAMAEQIRTTLTKALGLGDEDIRISRWRRQVLSPTSDCTWHFDYGQHSSAVYTAILYLAHDGEEALVGGHTAFVAPQEEGNDSAESLCHVEGGSHHADSVALGLGVERLANGTAYLRQGWLVAPRVGRLLLFSGGAENYHAAMPVERGRRQSLLVWFECACDSEMRAARETTQAETQTTV